MRRLILVVVLILSGCAVQPPPTGIPAPEISSFSSTYVSARSNDNRSCIADYRPYAEFCSRGDEDHAYGRNALCLVY